MDYLCKLCRLEFWCMDCDWCSYIYPNHHVFFFGRGTHFFWRWMMVFPDGSTSKISFHKPDASWFFFVSQPTGIPDRNDISVRKTTEKFIFSVVFFLSANSDGAPTEKYFLTVIHIILTVFGLQGRPLDLLFLLIILLLVFRRLWPLSTVLLPVHWSLIC